MTNSLARLLRGFEGPTTPKFVTRVASLFCLVYFMAWIDKANIGYAKLQMLKDLHLSEARFGLGASMFFIGYVIADLAIVFLLPRMKAAHLLSLMALGIGGVTILLGLTHSTAMFYGLRFLLGLFEGGVSPAIFFYVMSWAPYGDRARVTGLILGVALAANVVGGVICGALLDLDGLAGLRGWQWLFFMTSFPSLVLSVVVFFLVPSGPEQATFYTPAEKAALARILKAEQAAMASTPSASVWTALGDRRVWLIMALLAVAASGVYGLSYWLPTVIQQFGVSNTVNGLLNSLPWLLGILTMLWLPARAERHGRAGLWMLLLLLAGAAAFALMALTQDKVTNYVLICIGAIGMLGLQPLFVIMPSRFLRGPTLAAVLPLIALASNLGAFFSQNAISRIGAAYGPISGLLVIAGLTAIAAVLAWTVDQTTATGPADPPAAARRSALS